MKLISDTLLSKSGLKEVDTLSPLLFNFALKYVNRKVQGKQEGLNLYGTHQHLAYADVNLLGEENMYQKEKHRHCISCYKKIGLKC
jgi:hypothetical protein